MAMPLFWPVSHKSGTFIPSMELTLAGYILDLDLYYQGYMADVKLQSSESYRMPIRGYSNSLAWPAGLGL